MKTHTPIDDLVSICQRARVTIADAHADFAVVNSNLDGCQVAVETCLDWLFLLQHFDWVTSDILLSTKLLHDRIRSALYDMVVRCDLRFTDMIIADVLVHVIRWPRQAKAICSQIADACECWEVCSIGNIKELWDAHENTVIKPRSYWTWPRWPKAGKEYGPEFYPPPAMENGVPQYSDAAIRLSCHYA
jgi:hypothetical protein